MRFANVQSGFEGVASFHDVFGKERISSVLRKYLRRHQEELYERRIVNVAQKKSTPIASELGKNVRGVRKYESSTCYANLEST